MGFRVRVRVRPAPLGCVRMGYVAQWEVLGLGLGVRVGVRVRVRVRV